MALKGETPAKRVGVEMKGKNKWLNMMTEAEIKQNDR